MSIQLNDEQLMIQSMVRDFSREVIAPTAAERDKNKALPAENLKRLAELGFMGMMVAPEYNGSGADMATEIEAGRQLMLSAAAMKDRGVNFSMQASMAKLYASEMVNRVTARAVQMHGGYGFIREYPVERFYRDARVFTIYEGPSEIQRIVISNHIFQDKRTP
jgi:alkylation response protein AidB-like acyl-CoA dehydrogenase